MKRFFLTIFFAFYHMFMPFVLMNCSSSADLPYALKANADESVTDDSKLAACRAQVFLTADCVEVIQAADASQESAAESIVTAYDELADFIQCEAATTSTDAATADTVDCAQVVSDVLAGYDICQVGTVSGKDNYCSQIGNDVSDATEQCDNAGSSVTADFCGILG